MKKLDKKFRMGKGKYWLTIKSNPNNITLYRKTKDSAVLAYQKYCNLGKDCEWHGKWNGKKFEESTPPVLTA